MNKAVIKFLTGLLTNLAAGWIGAIIILIGDILMTILCSLIAIELERRSNEY